MFEITADDIALLKDDDLRAVVGRLCESEMRRRGISASCVTWGGHQDAPDAGIDVFVSILSDRRESKGLPSQSLPLLIANLELEFHISPIRIIELKFSNRKYLQLFHSPWRIVEGSQAGCSHRSNSNSRITEKELSHTKERRKQNSNSNKIAFSTNSALHAFSQPRSALAARCHMASVTDPLSSAPNLAIIDFPVRGHL
jgi:hypothetical protein